MCYRLGYVSTEDEAAVKCKEISLRFGGSGYKNVAATASHNVPVLLAAPVKLIDNSGLKAPSKVSYGATFMASSSDTSSALSVNSNTQFDVSAIPTTQVRGPRCDRMPRVAASVTRTIHLSLFL